MDDVALTKLVCTLLGEITGWEYRDEGPAYAETLVGVYYGSIKERPDRAVGVRMYLPEDDRVTGLAVRRVQVRYRGSRGDPTGADTLADAGFARLHTLSRVGGISDSRRLSSSGPLGADTNGREERTDNFEIILDNPEA